MTRRILLAWEGGAGRGHIVTLKVMAEALGPSHLYEAALCRMDHAAELAPLCQAVYPSASLYLHRAPRRGLGWPHTASWADFLGDLGFAFPGRLQVQFDWWVEVLRARRIDLVISDFAPISLLAARVLGIASVCVGTGYSAPPPGMARFPILMPQHDILVHDEAVLLDNVNALLVRSGSAPLAHFSDLYAASVSMPRTIRQLDPYDGLRAEPLLPPLNEALQRATPDGDEIFVYFSTAETAYAPLVDALCAVGLPIRAYLPGADPAIAERLAAAGVMLETRPVAVEQIAARSRITLNAGQHGSLCMGLGLGLQQLSFPQHLEHEFHTRRAAALDAADIVPFRAWSASRIVDAIRALYHDRARQSRTRDLARALYPDLFGDIGTLVRARLLPLLG
jgi:UDP:flavonoid glycosyltransferase YjiC (YdhE family)